LEDRLLLPFNSEFFFRSSKFESRGALKNTSIRNRFLQGFVDDILNLTRSLPMIRYSIIFIDRSKVTTKMNQPMPKP
jgi:hypothetical protein